MRIACPSCAAEYDVPASRVKPGRMVRCARCGGEWMAEEVEDLTADVELGDAAQNSHSEPEPTLSAHSVGETGRSAASRSPLQSRAGLIGAWLLTGVLVTGGIAAAVVWRDEIMRRWPASSRILTPTGHSIPQPAQTAGNGVK